MPATISRKICLRIVERYVTSRKDLCALSATNRLLREVTLPFLFRVVRFDGMLPNHLFCYDEETDHGTIFQHLINIFRRVCKRIEGLKTHSHLQIYITTLEIRGWSFLNSLMDEDPDRYHDPEYCFVQDSWNTTYDILGSFIRDLPSLKTLHIAFSPMSKPLQQSFYLSKRLEKIVLYGCQMDISLSTIRRQQAMTRLKDLIYEYDPRYPKIAPASFRQLLSRSLPTLSSLTFPMECVIPVAALLCRSPHALSHLTITESKFSPVDSEMAEGLYALLDSCIELETLAIHGWVDEALPDLENHVPPRLTGVSGTASLIRAASSGRPVSSIHFKYCPLDPILPSSFILDRPSTACVRRVSIDCSTMLRPDILQALSKTFPFVQFLTILFVRGYKGDRCSAVSVSC